MCSALCYGSRAPDTPPLHSLAMPKLLGESRCLCRPALLFFDCVLCVQCLIVPSRPVSSKKTVWRAPQPERVDIAQCSELPVTLVFLPAHDIAMFVGEGNVDIGITGLDVVRETSEESEIEVAMVREGSGRTKALFITAMFGRVLVEHGVFGRSLVLSRLSSHSNPRDVGWCVLKGGR